MKKQLPLIIIIVSCVLIIANFITLDKLDIGFFMRVLSSVLIIIAMILAMKVNKKG